MRIYMAGPLFTKAEIDFNAALARELRANGHEVFLPQDFQQDQFDARAVFLHDVRGIDWCQLVLANMDGADQDSGTCWELGYAYAKDKYTMTYRTDFRRGKEAVNLMMTESSLVNFDLPSQFTMDAIASRIDMEIRTRLERSPTHRARMQPDQFGGFDVVSDPRGRVPYVIKEAVSDPRGPNDKFADAIKEAAGVNRTERLRHSDK